MSQAWSKVTHFSNIYLHINNEMKESTLHGNGLNCLDLCLSFNGRDASNSLLDLSDEFLPKSKRQFSSSSVDKMTDDEVEIINSRVSVVDFDTGIPFPVDPKDEDKKGVYVGRYRTLYTDDPGTPVPISGSRPKTEDEELCEARLVFFVFCKSDQEFKQRLSIRLKLSCGDYVHFDNLEGDAHYVTLNVIKPFVYTIDDLEPIVWEYMEQVGKAQQYNAYIKPRHTRWRRSRFEGIKELETILARIAVTEKDGRYFRFYACPIGMPGAVYIDKMNFSFNRERGSFCLVKFDEAESKYELELNEDFYVTLFDNHGNRANFDFDWTDKSDPWLKVRE